MGNCQTCLGVHKPSPRTITEKIKRKKKNLQQVHKNTKSSFKVGQKSSGRIMANNGSLPPPSIPPYAAGAPIPPHQPPQHPAAPPYGGYAGSSPSYWNPTVAGSAGTGFPPNPLTYGATGVGFPPPGDYAPPPQAPQRSLVERMVAAVLGHAVGGAIGSFISDVLEIVGYSET